MKLDTGQEIEFGIKKCYNLTMKINIRPLSVNDCWRGRRFKTPAYKAYEQEMFYLLPKKMVIPKGKLFVKIRWAFSSKASDIDNPIKPLLDILQKKYGFNDKMIYKLEVGKVDVKKGEEFIDFEILTLLTNRK